MLRRSPATRALVSLVSLLAYLAAAGLECERPDVLPERGEAIVVSHAGQVGDVPSMAAHAHGAATSPSSTARAHAGHSDHHSETVESESNLAFAAVEGHATELVFMPTCLCGCSETRALAPSAGGNLGAAAIAIAIQSPTFRRAAATSALSERHYPNIEPHRDPLPI